MTLLSNWCHKLGHRLDPSATPCVCRVSAFHDAIAMRRNAELKELELPSSPDAQRDEMWIRERAS
jgi:hypothetical protein